MTYLWLGCFGIGVGVLSGLLGIGGGVALVPGLMLFFGFTQAEAQGTSLAVLIPPIGIFAALVYWQNGFVRLPVVGWVAAGFVVGAFVGALMVPYVPQGALRNLFGALLVYVGFTFLVTPPGSRSAALLPTGLATFWTLIVGRWLRRWTSPPAPLPPGEDVEYHI
jgi:uncharacterized membrane protein YfcA